MSIRKFNFDMLRGSYSAIISVVIALIIGSIVLIISGINPIEAYAALIYGAFGNFSYLGDTLARSTPIIFTGLAIGIAFRGGMFNIGAEGQLAVGAICAAIAGYAFNLPMVLHLPISIICGIIGGGLWALIPAVLKAKKGVHEVISTIMMNYIALSIGGYIIEALRRNEMPQTPDVLESSYLVKLSSFIPAFENSNLNIGFFIAIACSLLVHFLIKRTVFGYEVRAMGFNPLASEDAGVNISGKIIWVMMISGALSGLAGTERVLGLHHTYLSGISTNFGFEGIAVALLANNNPITIIFSALLFGALSSGGQYMNLAADVPIDIVGIIQGLIILFAAISQAGEVINLYKLFKKKEVAK